MQQKSKGECEIQTNQTISKRAEFKTSIVHSSNNAEETKTKPNLIHHSLLKLHLLDIPHIRVII